MKAKNKLTIFIFVLISFFFSTAHSFADEFNNLNISVNIDKNGVAKVNETWDTVDEEGTEKYKPIKNLGQIKIEDFKASVNGRDFSPMNPWNVDLSFDQKAYKYGINTVDGGIELCWGISNYGKNTHKISYTINPLVISLNDYDMVYWQFVNSNMSVEPENVNITISGFEDFDDQVKMWGFGLEGDISNQNGSIVMQSSGRVNYATVMLRFPKGYFNSPYKIDKNFKDYADQAIVGSRWEDTQGEVDTPSATSGTSSSWISLLPMAFSSRIFRFFIIYVIFLIFANKPSRSKTLKNFDRHKKFPEVSSLKEQYYRDVPYDGHIENLFNFVQKAYGRKISTGDFLNAFILKWIYDGDITTEKEEEGFFKKEKLKLVLVKEPKNMGQLEKKFYTFIKRSRKSRYSSKVSQEDFKDFSRKYSKEVTQYLDSFAEKTISPMKDSGYITETINTKHLFFTNEYIDPTDKGVELFTNLVKFKNYLEDYSLIKEREVEEVKIWDYYMIYAAIFGISDKVFKNLKTIYPEYETVSSYNYTTILWANSYARYASNSSYSNFSSGGSGGSTSFGGGGGSFGGGGGGGSR